MKHEYEYFGFVTNSTEFDKLEEQLKNKIKEFEEKKEDFISYQLNKEKMLSENVYAEDVKKVVKKVDEDIYELRQNVVDETHRRNRKKDEYQYQYSKVKAAEEIFVSVKNYLKNLENIGKDLETYRAIIEIEEEYQQYNIMYYYINKMKDRLEDMVLVDPEVFRTKLEEIWWDLNNVREEFRRVENELKNSNHVLDAIEKEYKEKRKKREESILEKLEIVTVIYG